MAQRFLLGWGSASDGQLGASNTDALTPRPLPGLPTGAPLSVVPGLWSSLILTSDNVYITRAPDDIPRSPVPLPRQNCAPSFVSAARGRDFTLLLSPAGKLYSLGAGAFGELGLGDRTSVSVPTLIQAISHIKIIAITAAEFHWLALDASGTVFSCGNNKSGQLGLDHPESVSTPTRVTSLWPHPIVAISTGDGHSAALSACGKLYCFGSNKHGQLGNDTFRVRVMSVTPAIVPLPSPRSMKDESVDDDLMEIDTPQSSSSTISSVLTNGTAVPATNQMETTESRTGLRYVDVACGSAHTVALRSDGVLVCWGMGENGRLGTRSTRSLYEPTEIETNVPFVTVSAGERHSAAVTADGRAFVWGDGSSGQLGLGDITDKYVPVELVPPRIPGVYEPLRYLRVQCGGFHTLAVVGNTSAPVYNAIDEHDTRIPRCVVDNMLHPRAGLSRFGCASVLLRTFLKWGSGTKAEYEVDYVGAETAHLKFIRMFGDEGRRILRLAAAQVRRHAQIAFGLISEDRMDTQDDTALESSLVVPKSQLIRDTSQFRLSVANSAECGYLFFLAMMNPAYGDAKYLPELSELASIVLRVEEAGREAFLQSISRCDEGVLVNRILRPLQRVLTDELRGHRRITRNAVFATKMLALCYHGVCRASHRFKSHGLGNLRKEFYNDTVSERVNLREDYERWLQGVQQGGTHKRRAWLSDGRIGVDRRAGSIELPPLPVAGKDEGHFAFCSYSFLLTEAAKFKILGVESTTTMQMETVRSLLSFGALQMPMGGSSYIALPAEQMAHVQFLVLHVSRNRIVSDTYSQVADIASRMPRELRKPLRVVFEGEVGVDEGGVSKEFYQVLMEQILSPDYGMFVHDEENHIHWFQKNFLEPEDAWSLIGIMFGLAVFNSILLEVHFPSVVYRKMAVEMRNAELARERKESRKGPTEENGLEELKYWPDLDDVKEVFPAIGNSLQHLRDYKGDDVEDVFGLSFEVSYRGMFDKVENFELIEDGANVAVTNENKEDFINRYVEFLINGSIERAFKPFAAGFVFMLDGPFVSRLTGEELETLVVGERELDFAGLRQATQYEGYSEKSEVIVHLWQVLDEFDETMKRLFLSFVTGTNRAPIGGLSKLKLIIQRASSDTDRLPTSHTCFNVLLLPEYGTRAKLRDRLSTAIRNSKGFGLQ